MLTRSSVFLPEHYCFDDLRLGELISHGNTPVILGKGLKHSRQDGFCESYAGIFMLKVSWEAYPTCRNPSSAFSLFYTRNCHGNAHRSVSLQQQEEGLISIRLYAFKLFWLITPVDMIWSKELSLSSTGSCFSLLYLSFIPGTLTECCSWVNLSPSTLCGRYEAVGKSFPTSGRGRLGWCEIGWRWQLCLRQQWCPLSPTPTPQLGQLEWTFYYVTVTWKVI